MGGSRWGFAHDHHAHARIAGGHGEPDLVRVKVGNADNSRRRSNARCLPKESMYLRDPRPLRPGI
jgi:hypothetical protein